MAVRTGQFTFLWMLLSGLLPAVSAVQSSSFNIEDFSVALNIPSPNHSDDLYFHLSTPNDPEWVAFGFGSQMAGSLIFVVYGSEDGQNVTISPRLATGHVMPTHTSEVQVDRLAGTGFSDQDNNLVVNAKCTGCRSWNGGKIDTTSTNQPIIMARGPSGVLNTDDLDATIQQHGLDDHYTTSLNAVAATGPGGVPTADNTDDGPGNGFGGGFGGGFGDGSGDDDSPSSVARRVHAVFMVGAFLVGFPAGYMFLRLLDRVWIHWTLQSIAAVAVLLGMVTGVMMSIKQSISPKLNAYHQILGFVVTAMVILTWTAGFVGHRMYKKSGTPAPAMKVHRILGPSTVIFGLVNCAVGFHFAGENRGIIGFVILTVIMVIFVNTVLYFARRRKQRQGAFNSTAAQNFRQGQTEAPPYGYPAGYQGSDNVPLQPYGARPEPHSLPSYHSDGGQAPLRYA